MLQTKAQILEAKGKKHAFTKFVYRTGIDLIFKEKEGMNYILKKGRELRDIPTEYKTPMSSARLKVEVITALIELMTEDVIAGHMVKMGHMRKGDYYVTTKLAPPEFYAAANKKRQIETIDMEATGHKTPTVVLDLSSPGGAIVLAGVRLPIATFSQLIRNLNKKTKFTRGMYSIQDIVDRKAERKRIAREAWFNRKYMQMQKAKEKAEEENIRKTLEQGASKIYDIWQ